MTTSSQLLAATLLSLTTLSACARTPDPAHGPVAVPSSSFPDTARQPAAQTAAASMASAAATALPLVVVHKSASCGCCAQWVDHLREAGFRVDVRNQENLNPIKERVGVPLVKGSCHTAEVGGYFVEGHVPAGDIKRLLAQKPDAKGLVLPGMPAGSPGMETPDGTTQAYTVELVTRDGSITPFARH